MDNRAKLEDAELVKVKIEALSEFIFFFSIFFLFLFLLVWLVDQIEFEDKVNCFLLTDLCFLFALKKSIP